MYEKGNNNFSDLLFDMVFNKLIRDYDKVRDLWKHFLDNREKFFPGIAKAQLDKQIEVFTKEGSPILLLDAKDFEVEDNEC